MFRNESMRFNLNEQKTLSSQLYANYTQNLEIAAII